MATIDFVVSGNRIATESFAIGKIYEIIFTNGNSLICACNHVGNNFVVFQRELPELLFTLNMETASSVRSIEETEGGGGTYNYNELDNKPQINSVELTGNKSSSDLGLQSALDASQLDAVNSGITAAKVTSFEAKQDAITLNSKLSADLVNDTTTTNKFVTAAEKTAWNAKQNALTASQLDAVNSGITAAKVTSFEGKQDAITSSNKLSADLVNDATTANKFVTAADKTAWNAKQNALTFDDTPIQNSSNPVKSGGIYTALSGKQDTIDNLAAIESGAAAGATAVQPAMLDSALALKQDTLTTAQLAAVNSGITSEDVEQIETNKNNILSLTPTNTTTEYTATAAETWEKTPLSIPVAGKKAVYFAGNIMYNNAEPLGVGIGTGSTFTTTSIIAVEESNAGTLRGALSCTGIYYNNSPSPQTLYLWAKYKTTQKNMITLMYRQL